MRGDSDGGMELHKTEKSVAHGQRKTRETRYKRRKNKRSRYAALLRAVFFAAGAFINSMLTCRTDG